MNPALAGVVVPTVWLIILAAIPYLDRAKEGQGTWFGTLNSVRITIWSMLFGFFGTLMLILFDSGKHVQLYEMKIKLFGQTVKPSLGTWPVGVDRPGWLPTSASSRPSGMPSSPQLALHSDGVEMETRPWASGRTAFTQIPIPLNGTSFPRWGSVGAAHAADGHALSGFHHDPLTGVVQAPPQWYQNLPNWLTGLFWYDLNLNLPAFVVEILIPSALMVGLPIFLIYVLWRIGWVSTRRDVMITLFSGFIASYWVMTIVGAASGAPGSSWSGPGTCPQSTVRRKPDMRLSRASWDARGTWLAPWRWRVVNIVTPIEHSLSFAGGALSLIALVGWSLKPAPWRDPLPRSSLSTKRKKRPRAPATGPSPSPSASSASLSASSTTPATLACSSALPLAAGAAAGWAAAIREEQAAGPAQHPWHVPAATQMVESPGAGSAGGGFLMPVPQRALAAATAGGAAIAFEQPMAQGVSRRGLMRITFWAGFGAGLAALATSLIDFIYPRGITGFGGVVVAGTTDQFLPDTKTAVAKGKLLDRQPHGGAGRPRLPRPLVEVPSPRLHRPLAR